MDMSSLPRAGELSEAGVRVSRWQPGLPCAWHSEVFAQGDEGGGAALALTLAIDGLPPERLEQGEILWVQDAASLCLTGRPYYPGLPPALRRRVIHVAARNCEDALFALEEGLRCRDFAFVIGEIAGNPRALDFTASRRLTLAAERHGVPLWLVRVDARRDLSSARMRWQVQAAPSLPPRWNPQAPGRSGWRAELFRARGHAPGKWILHDDGNDLVAAKTAHGDLASAPGDRSLATR